MTETDRILVVEDEPLVSEIIAAALEDTYATTVVDTAEKAIAQLRTGAFRLMLLDCTLPDGSEVDVIPEADQAGTAVILMSGDPARMAGLTDRPRPFLQKPFSLNGLLAAVETVLAAASGTV
jgi:DNA-binding response OmpR family regulator